MTRRTGTYEVREDRLYVDGQAVGTDRRVVREVLHRFRAMGELLPAGPLPRAIALQIIDQDRRIALARLQAELLATVA